MKIEKEQVLQTQDLDKTPKAILEQLFSYIENHRIKTEENELSYFNKKVYYFKNLIEELKDDAINLGKEELKENKKTVDVYEKFIKDYKKEISKIHENLNILWDNELKIGRILNYELED